MTTNTRSAAAEHIDHTIRTRRTLKVLSDQPLPVDRPGMLSSDSLDALCTAAGWAPFHKPAERVHQVKGGLDAIMPWRLHVVEAAGCRKLREELIGQGDESKVPMMLAAADAVILATWLPNRSTTDAGQLFEPTLDNMEHLAAASAAVQNLLLAATARGIENYWSSGGGLREPAMFDRLGIPRHEILLGALFFFPAEDKLPDHVDLKTSTLRNQRGEVGRWTRRVSL